MNKTICVYSSSSCALDQSFFEMAAELGREIGRRKDALIYGGGLVGLMGATARGVHEYQGKVIGVIPEALHVKGIVYEQADELIVTREMRERKAIMENRADAFIALPGGYGTLEELLEIITLKQLRYHNKPVVIFNTNQFYEPLIQQFDKIMELNFAKDECARLYHVTEDIKPAMDYIDSYKAESWGPKWLTDVESREG